MSIDSIGTRPLDIGAVLGDTFAVIGRTFVVLANVAVMLVAIPAAINIAGVALTPVSPVFAILSVIGSLASGVGMLLAYGAIFLLAMQDLHGQSVSTDVMFRTALSKFWPLLGVAILLVIGVGLGSLLLIVPGIILGLAWSVAMPALVLEDRRVFESFGRSAALTRNKRWSIFLLFFLVGLIAGIMELVLFAVFGGFQGLVSRQPSTVSTVLTALSSVVTVPFGAVLYTALFNQLRGNAGYGAEAVAEVFA
jgi:membrane-anchored glycerophosphoryl diester phosphodiesterase (GDPDase)